MHILLSYIGMEISNSVAFANNSFSMFSRELFLWNHFFIHPVKISVLGSTKGESISNRIADRYKIKIEVMFSRTNILVHFLKINNTMLATAEP